MIYSYKAKRRNLTDIVKLCLCGGDEVVCSMSPRELKLVYCADFQFPNGDTFDPETGLFIPSRESAYTVICQNCGEIVLKQVYRRHDHTLKIISN